MNFYDSELDKIRKTVYANQSQLDKAITLRNYLDAHYDKGLNLDGLSRLCFTSKFHLLRLFRKYYGQTPIQYLTDRRMEKARSFLAAGMCISETCFACGFESPASFATLFRHRTGLSPTVFKKRQFSQSLPNAAATSLED